MKLDCLLSCSQLNRSKEKKNNLTSKQSKLGRKGVFIVIGSLHV